MRHATPIRPKAAKKPHRFWHNLFASKLPHTHLIAAAGVATALVIGLVAVPGDNVEAKRELPEAIEKQAVTSTDFEIPAADVIPLPARDEAAYIPETTQLTWHEVTVRSGDSLSTLFQRATLGARDVHEFVSSSDSAKNLQRIMPGEQLSFGLNKEGRLDTLRYRISQLESWQFERTEQGYNAEHVALQPELLSTFREAEITSSLFVAADSAGMPHNLIMEMAGIFGWDIDFALDIRKGDHFAVLYEEKFLNGEIIGTGNILAAEFTNQGKTFSAVRFEDENGHANYYTPEGMSMRKAFKRTPVDFARVSSGFNMRRLHPITKKVKPHRGIDYAAPTGTPVYAAGDGKVVRAGYTSANGNYVVIQHGQKYQTKYLHLHKRKVKKGQTVRQGQTIGTVGSTGLATGPHLHYEFLVDGVHRNPRTVQLPKAEPIDSSIKAQFLAQTGPAMAKLAKMQSAKQYAQANEPKSNDG